MIAEISPQDLLLANEEGDGQRRSVGCLIFLFATPIQLIDFINS